MLKAARMNDTSTPATSAPTRPTHGDPVIEAMSAEVNAPARNWPSMAMFTTPTRSEMTPPRAPNTSGTLRLSAPRSRPGMASDAPAADHARKPITNTTAKAVVTQSGTRRYERVSTTA